MFLEPKYTAMITQSQTPIRNIFLADDDDDDRLLFVEALNEIDNSVSLTIAEDGKQLMDILNTSPNTLPDVVFLDVNMPKKNGFECLEEIRKQNNNLRDLNIIIFTTCDKYTTMEKAYELGATFFAVKPNKFSDLKLLINDVLQMDWFSVGRDKKFRLI